MTQNQALAYGTDYTGEALRPGDRVVVMNGPYAEMGGELGAKSPSADGRTRGVVVFDDGQVGTSYLDLLAKVAPKSELSPQAQAYADWQEATDEVAATTAKLQAAQAAQEQAFQAEADAWAAYQKARS